MLNPWEYWTASDIAQASGCPVDNVESNWPVLHESLVEFGITSRNSHAAIIATIAIETASRFLPISEFRNADGTIPSYWHNYGGGARYHGRGFIQLTHDYNYRHVGNNIGYDLFNNPELANLPDVAAKALAFYCSEPRGIDRLSVAQAADNEDWRGVRIKVLGGTGGLDRLTDIIVNLLSKPEPVVDNTVQELTQKVHDLITGFAHVADVWVPEMVEAKRKRRREIAKLIKETRINLLGPKP